MIFLIDKPFVSDFLCDTIRENNSKIVATLEARELIHDASLNWMPEDEAISFINENQDEPIYLNSENAIGWIIRILDTPKLVDQINQFKDKARFRELMNDLFPDFFYITVALEDVQNFIPDASYYPFVIKPSVGFFSLGVHTVRSAKEWEAAKTELRVAKLQSIYPEEVFNSSTFIIEEYIEGEEYAVDCYFNNEGEAVILNILHHKFSSGSDISDRVYTSSKDIILRNIKGFEDFLTLIGRRRELKNFPLHVELRVDKNGKINPIEVNPMRFGGWCTTGDLLWYAFGINPYECFIKNEKPDWDKAFYSRTNKSYSIVVLNNNSGYESSEISSFDYDLLCGDFEKVLVARKMDVNRYSVFGFLFLETSEGNEEELDEILVSDLRRYIVCK